ncbi:MAG: response regulator transcription factor [Calditrichaeota bacterium]|nr:response regulator transcription factor [Calditrichota bacterium]MCB9391595.1 response regulator transcription factor [Calditrichota bacterium]
MNSVRILIADDHKLFRLGMKSLLEAHPEATIVGEAATGLDAIHFARDLNPDIVLMDISMPELNGIESTRRICDENSEARVIIVSMHSDRRYVTEALRAGAKGYLLKDSAPEEIFRAIHKTMSGRFYLSPQINDQVIAEFVKGGGTADTAFDVLSAREREVLQLLAEGKSNKQAAELLCLSVKTVETHRMHIMEKLDLHSLPELTRYAIREGLTPLE